MDVSNDEVLSMGYGDWKSWSKLVEDLLTWKSVRNSPAFYSEAMDIDYTTLSVGVTGICQLSSLTASARIIRILTTKLAPVPSYEPTLIDAHVSTAVGR